MLAIVVDSTCALTRAEAARLGVTVVSSTYEVDGAPREETFLDENGDYAALLAAGRLTGTHAPGAPAFRAAFERLAGTGEDILCVTISSRLAGAYRNACKAADEAYAALKDLPGSPRVAVLDSLSGFSNTEYLVTRARRLADEGRTLDEIAADLVEARTRQGICFSVPSTEPLRNAGRLSMLPQSVTTMLNRFPVLTMRDGAISCVDTVRGTHALAQAMVDQVPADANDLLLAHYGARGPLVVELLRATKERFPRARVRVKDAGPVLSCNLGEGAASVAWGPRGE